MTTSVFVTTLYEPFSGNQVNSSTWMFRIKPTYHEQDQKGRLPRDKGIVVGQGWTGDCVFDCILIASCYTLLEGSMKEKYRPLDERMYVTVPGNSDLYVGMKGEGEP